MKIKINNKLYKFVVEIVKQPVDTIKLKSFIDKYKRTKPKLNMTTEERSLLTKLRRELKQEIKKLTDVGCECTLFLGPYWMKFESDTTLNDECLKEYASSMIKHLKTKKKKNKSYSNKPTVVTKDFLGIKYETIGGVFTKPKSLIGNVIHTMDNIETDKVPRTNDDYIGVEIEMFSDYSRKQLNQAFIDKKLTLKVNNKSDGSISADLGKTASETTVLFKYKETNSVMKSVCDVLKSGNASVNNTCGLHVHIDVRNKNHKVVYHNLVSCLGILNQLVPQNRVSGSWAESYCKQNISPDFNDTIPTRTRYQAINPVSYNKFKTIEVRMHSGSVNATKISNFVHILQAIADKKEKIASPIIDINEFVTTFGINEKLSEYIVKRASHITRSADTVSDILTDELFEVAA